MCVFFYDSGRSLEEYIYLLVPPSPTDGFYGNGWFLCQNVGMFSIFNRKI